MLALATSTAASTASASASASSLPGVPNGNGQTVSINSGNAAGTDFTLTSKTIQVPSSLLKSVTAGGATYTFAGTGGPLAKVAVGKVVLIEGEDAIVVTSVKRSGGQLIVGAAPASIGDVIESGQLKVTGAPDMAQAVGVTDGTAGLTPALAPALGSAAVPSGARQRPEAVLTTFPSYSYSGKTSSFSYSLTFAGAPNGIHVTGTICYACDSALNINAKLDGTFTWANQDLDLDLAGGKVKSGSFGISGMSSDLDLTYTVLRGASPGVGAKPPVFKLPVSFEAPLCICGGIPVYSKFELAILVTLGIGAKNSSIQGGVHVTLTGSGSVSGTGLGGAGGSWTGGHIKGNFITGTALTPASAGIVVALQAKFGVGMGVKNVNALYYISPIFSIGETTGSAIAGLACVAFDGDFSITGNFEVQLLGFKVSTPATTLWDKKASYKQPPC
ncbi:MAG: hypothetical protein ACLQVK_07250 [Acidimicrobiales bacterium]